MRAIDARRDRAARHPGAHADGDRGARGRRGDRAPLPASARRPLVVVRRGQQRRRRLRRRARARRAGARRRAARARARRASSARAREAKANRDLPAPAARVERRVADDAAAIARALGGCDLIVDAVFGVGLGARRSRATPRACCASSRRAACRSSRSTCRRALERRPGRALGFALEPELTVTLGPAQARARAARRRAGRVARRRHRPARASRSSARAYARTC